MKLVHEDTDGLLAEIEYWKTRAENYRLGLIAIIQMERFPDHEDTRPDWVTATGKFANEVLNGEWPK